MHGELAQAIALVAYGNVFLNGQSQAPELLETNSTLQYIDNVKFLYGSSLRKAIEVSNNVPSWFSYLRTLNAKRLWLMIFPSNIGTPEPIATSFAATGRWVIQVDLPDGFDFWTANWHSPLKPLRPSKRWEVMYWGNSLKKPMARSPNLESAKADLLSEIAKARDLVSRTLLTFEGETDEGPRLPLKFYLGVFTEVLQLAVSSNPKIPYHPDLLPLTGYDLKARQVAAMAVRAWVFGGMSSWNDLEWVFKGSEKEYHQITEKLYAAVTSSLVNATNSFVPQRPLT